MATRGKRLCLGLASFVAWLCAASPALAASPVTLTPVSFSVVEGQSYSGGPVATFFDPAGIFTASAYSAQITWGDGTVTPGTVSGSSVAGWTVTGTHAYAEEGQYQVTVSVTNSSAATFAAIVEPEAVGDAPLTSASPSGALSFAGAGSAAASADGAFTASIGGADNGATPAESVQGFRKLTWDAIQTDGSDGQGTVSINAHDVAIAPGRTQPYGLRAAAALAVTNDGFASVNASVGSKLTAVTASNIAAPFNSNTLELDVVAPTSSSGSAVPQATRGIGVMLRNVTAPNVTSVAYYDGTALIARVFAPVGGSGQPSFVGELFPAAIVTRVVITLGTSAIFGWNGTSVLSGETDGVGGVDLVAADDVVLAEPAPEHPSLSATVGVPFSGALDTFADTNPTATTGLASAHEYAAVVEWGDGVTDSATLEGVQSPFTVAATHTFTTAGTFPVTVVETDYGGATRTTSFQMVVAPRAAASSVACASAQVRAGQALVCAVTVTDTSPGVATSPTGSVSFSTSAPGGGFGPGGTCTLVPTPGVGKAACSVTFMPGQPGSATILATYGGDGAHRGSVGTASVAVSPAASIAPQCSIKTPGTKLARRAKSFAVTVTCDLGAAVKLTAVASLTANRSHKHTQLAFGSANGTDTPGRTLKLVLKPSPKVLAKIRATARHGQVSLSFTLVANSPLAQSTANGRVAKLTVAG